MRSWNRLPGTFMWNSSTTKINLMRILIIGGTSSVGRALKEKLSEANTVVTAGREDCDIYLDLNEPVDKINFYSEFDAVVHIAAQFNGRTVKEIVETENVNVLGTLKICHAALQAKAKHFILISSIFVCLG